MPATLLRPRWFFSPALRPKLSEPRDSSMTWIIPTIVFLLALVLAVGFCIQFLRVHRFLWDEPLHDRNAHYLFSLRLATDLRSGRFLSFLKHVEEARVWPPLHGLLAAGMLLVGGCDYRWAVLPNVAAWVCTVLLGFLIARRVAPRGGTLAGMIAAMFLAASPAHRAYATDIMLEGLGAALSLAALYCYLRAVQDGKGRGLAVVLTALFLEKYNYWLLIVLTLLTAEWQTRPYYRQLIRSALTGANWRCWIFSQLRHPLTWAIGCVLLLSAGVFLHGDRPLLVAGCRLSLYPPHNLFHLAYILLFLRLLPWWWRRGRPLLRQLDHRWRQIVLWHIYPLSIWFLLPKRPSNFLWYLSLANRTSEQRMDLIEACRDYTTWLIDDYHFNLPAATLAVGLCLSGLLTWRRWRSGGRAILALAVLGALLTLIHPNHKGRMLHSWVSALWIAAGVGAAQLAANRVILPWRRLRGCLAAALLIGVAAVQFPAWTAEGHAFEGGPHPDHPSLLDVTDAYFPHLDHANRALILTAAPLKPLVQWTFLERYGRLDRLDERWYGFGSPGAENRFGFTRWLETTDCDTVIYCDPLNPKECPDAGPECSLHAELMDIPEVQRFFQRIAECDLPACRCRIQVWKRRIGSRQEKIAPTPIP